MNFKEFSKTIYAKIIICAASLLVLAVIGILLLNPGSKIAAGVSAGDVKIGGMTKEEAISVLSEKNLDIQQINISCGDEKMSFYGSDIELKRDLLATSENTYSIGRGKGFLKNTAELIRARFGRADISYAYSFNSEKLEEIIYNFGISINGELKNNIFEFSDEYVTVQTGTPGQSRDVSAAISQMQEAFNNEKYDIALTLEKSYPAEPTAESIAREIFIEPIDAAYEISDGKVIFTNEQYGRQIDQIELGTKINNLKNGEAITLKLIKTAPNITMADLNAKLFSCELGKYSTSYSASNKSRSSNLALAAEKINGMVLAPGEVFSYNDAVGPRTAENGFKEAQIYENGETVLGLGGGVCQVSSTLYSAVLYADLKIVSRRAHSMTVGYIPKGQDATVSYGSIDFKFENSTEYPIKISAETVSGKVNVSVWGTAETEKNVKIENTVTETVEPTIEETADKSLLTGEKKVISRGKTGYTVETVRKVYENGKLIKSEKLGTSVYKSVPTKVAVGAKVPEALPTLPPLSTPEPEQIPEGGE